MQHYCIYLKSTKSQKILITHFATTTTTIVTIIFLGKYLKRISKSLSETTTSFRNFCSCTFIWGNEMAINFRRTVTKGICFRTLFEQKYIEVGTSPGVQDHQCVVRVFFKGPKLRNISHLKDWGGRIFSFQSLPEKKYTSVSNSIHKLY